MVVRAPVVTVVTAALFTLTSVTAAAPRRVADITLTPASTFQVMRGWEMTAQSWRYTNDAWLQSMVDAGLDRVRVEVGAGVENTTNYLEDYLEAECPAYPDPTWQCDLDPSPGSSPEGDALRMNRYAVVNDNGDPDVLNAAGFYFTGLYWSVTRMVSPLRTKLAARGESLYVNLCYVAFVGAGSINPMANSVHQDPAEYAEFMFAVFDYMQDNFGFVPNGIEIILEPDNSVNFWGNSQLGPEPLIGEIMKAVGDRLDAEGYHPDIIMPSTTSYASVAGYINGAQTVTGAMAYLDEMSFHAYNQTGGTASIAADSADAGKCSSMLEWWVPENTYSFMHDLLANGNMCAYQRGVVHPLSEEFYYDYLQIYFRPVRMGATRIAAASSNGALEPLAWINANGTYAVIIKAASAQSFTVGDLPAGTYHIRYTTGAVTDGSHADQTITLGQDVSTSIPAAGVIGIYKGPLSVTRLPFRCCS